VPEKSPLPRVLIYGLDRFGLQFPTPYEHEAKHCVLVFERFGGDLRFDDFDGVVLCTGTFEEIKRKKLGHPYVMVQRKELTRREVEIHSLMKDGGFACFLVVSPVHDMVDYQHARSTDLGSGS
jgi:hypothetical protein